MTGVATSFVVVCGLAGDLVYRCAVRGHDYTRSEGCDESQANT